MFKDFLIDNQWIPTWGGFAIAIAGAAAWQAKRLYRAGWHRKPIVAAVARRAWETVVVVVFAFGVRDLVNRALAGVVEKPWREASRDLDEHDEAAGPENSAHEPREGNAAKIHVVRKVPGGSQSSTSVRPVTHDVPTPWNVAADGTLSPNDGLGADALDVAVRLLRKLNYETITIEATPPEIDGEREEIHTLVVK